MADCTNEDRAEFALSAVEAFMAACGTDREDAISDLICNLCHLSDQDGTGALNDIRRGLVHYYAETNDERLTKVEIVFTDEA